MQSTSEIQGQSRGPNETTRIFVGPNARRASIIFKTGEALVSDKLFDCLRPQDNLLVRLDDGNSTLLPKAILERESLSFPMCHF